MKKTVLIIAAVFILSALSLAVCGCTGQQNTVKDDSLQKILDKGELVLGLDVEFPPMGFIDENKETVGFDVDVAREVCDRLGVKLTLCGIDWDEKENDLNDGKIDCIWNGLSVTPARAEAMNLSEPYMKNELIVVVLGESTVKEINDLKNGKIGVQSGSTAEETLKELDIYKDITLNSYDNVMILLQKLDDGEIDAALVDSVPAYYYIFSKDKPYYILSDSLGEEEYAVGFRKGDAALRDRIQQIISDMKADGTLGKISKNWFGSDITTVK